MPLFKCSGQGQRENAAVPAAQPVHKSFWQRIFAVITGDQARQLSYEIKLMLSRVSWALASSDFLFHAEKVVRQWKVRLGLQPGSFPISATLSWPATMAPTQKSVTWSATWSWTRTNLSRPGRRPGLNQSINQSIKIFNKQLSDCNWTYTYELHE